MSKKNSLKLRKKYFDFINKDSTRINKRLDDERERRSANKMSYT
jgi:hypothetical protein